MRVPAAHVLFVVPGEAQQLAVIAHAPHHLIGVGGVHHLRDATLGHMICQHREVCRLVAVAAEIVERLSRLQAAALHEHHRIGVLHRRDAARAKLAHETGSAIVGPDGFAVGQLTDGELSPCSACNQVFVSGQPLQIIVLARHQRDGDSHIGRHLAKRLGREVVEVTGHAAPHLLAAPKPKTLTEERHIAGPAVGA